MKKAQEGIIGNNGNNGDGEIKGIGITDVYDLNMPNNGQSTLKFLVEPGEVDQYRSLLMRIDYPDKRTYAHIQALAFQSIIARCEKYGDKAGKEKYMNIQASFTSANGKRADMLVDAIIGERRQQLWGKRGFSDKLGDTAKKGFGGNQNTDNQG